MVAPIATTRIASPSNGLARVRQLATQVEESNACSLPGCPIKYDSFLTVMWRAVARGYVEHEHAVFVAQGLKQGFTAGVKREELFGQRIFKNYKSAVDAMEQVGRATQGRIDDGKTLCLGDWGQVNESLRDDVKDSTCSRCGSRATAASAPAAVRPASSSSSSSEVDETVQQRARRLAAARVVAATNERPPARRVAAAAARGASAQRSARRR